MACEILVRLYLLIFYTDVVGLDPKLAGIAAGVAIIWDAITDPMMGFITDNTKSRWGKRRPYILAGSFILAIAIVTLFSHPHIETQQGKFWFLLLSYMFVNTAMTVVAIPHAALGTEMSPDRNGITEIYAWRLVAGNAGAIAGTVIPGIFLTKTSDAANTLAARSTAHLEAAFTLAILVIVSAGITFFATRPAPNLARQQQNLPRSVPVTNLTNYRNELKSLVKNKPFVVLFIAYLIATIGVNINSSFAFYYYKYRLELTEADTQKIIAFFMIVFTAGLAGWIALAKNYGKKRPLVFGTTGLGVMTAVGYPLFSPGSFQGPLFAAIVGGFFVGSILILEAWLVDVIDYDAVSSRRQRAGFYFGVWKMGAKAARAIAVAMSGWTLSWIGFQPNSIQTADVSWRIALVFGPGVAVFFIVGGLLALAVPLEERHVVKIRRILEHRRQGDK